MGQKIVLNVTERERESDNSSLVLPEGKLALLSSVLGSSELGGVVAGGVLLRVVAGLLGLLLGDGLGVRVLGLDVVVLLLALLDAAAGAEEGEEHGNGHENLEMGVSARFRESSGKRPGYGRSDA